MRQGHKIKSSILGRSGNAPARFAYHDAHYKYRCQTDVAAAQTFKEKFSQESGIHDDRLNLIIERIAAAIAESAEDNWDGYGAKKIIGSSCEDAFNFLKSNFFINPPYFGCEPNGRLGMEWTSIKGGIAASFDGNGKVTFGGKIDGRSFSGNSISSLLERLKHLD